ncbi:MAG: LysM peptidoglycan-binding domain-containing protein [bacterium]
MKFSSASIKLKSKPHNEDFSLDVETPRGQFFALLDFGQHDYANLNATLKGKLETIVGSFVTLSRFSAELFLGFLAKEINNFLHNLGEQSGGPELLASGALCLVNGNRLTYFLCGDVQLNVVNNGRLLPLFGPAAGETATATGADPAIEQLGAGNREAPLTDVVQSFTLQDADLVLLLTRGLQDAFAGRTLSDEIAKIGSTDPQVICEALMKAGASARDDRSLVVMSGPYEKYLDPVLADLSKAVAALESRMEALNADQARGQVDSRIAQQLEVLKDDLRGKAAKIDLLELDEKVKSLGATLTQKVNSAGSRGESNEPVTQSVARHEDDPSRSPAMPVTMVALLVLAAALIGSVIGGWIQSRGAKHGPEAWSVKTAGNQITISRLDGEQATVTLDTSQPVNATGEQRFSSFADAKRYIDTISQTTAAVPSASPVAAPVGSVSPDAVTVVTVNRGDSLRTLAEQYNVPQGKLISLNPGIRRWAAIRMGQQIRVPAAGTAPVTTPITTPAPISSPAAQDQALNSRPNTTEITVAPGDSLNRLSSKYKVTPDQLRELNPHVSNWAMILPGQKIVVPAPPAG